MIQRYLPELGIPRLARHAGLLGLVLVSAACSHQQPASEWNYMQADKPQVRYFVPDTADYRAQGRALQCQGGAPAICYGFHTSDSAHAQP